MQDTFLLGALLFSKIEIIFIILYSLDIRFVNPWIECRQKDLKLSAVRLRRLSGFSRGDFLAACGGENGSD
ncbi:MAG TPA: hypothetical protein VJB70_00035 [Candidatus Paceibacterota bacterium]